MNTSVQTKPKEFRDKAKNESQDPILPKFNDIKNVILSDNVEELVKKAEVCAKYLRKVEPTQVRKFLDELVSIPECKKSVDLDIENKSIEKTTKSKLAILRPKFAYTVSRKGSSKLKDFNTNIIDSWLKDEKCLSTNKHLEYLHLFIESVVAFHKAENSKDNK